MTGATWGARGARCAGLLAMAALLLPAGAARAQIQLSVVGGNGLAGGTVSVGIELANDAAATAASASLDVAFPTDLLEFNGAVTDHCRVAARLADTHQIGGRLPQPGVLRLAIFAHDTTIAPLGEGPLATCDVHILPSAPDGTAPLTLQFVGVYDDRGEDLAATGVNGAIRIGAAPPCTGDCNGDGAVTIDELIRGVNIALGSRPLSDCPAMDRDGDGAVSISELITAVNMTLLGC
jgi:Cohesin domain/EF hand